ncbi:hypothetical protein AHF37_01128 [Paragonimus kellicotti]|nr:hypothetical protein AHF37_01128 [Paragonimus kellicotti]
MLVDDVRHFIVLFLIHVIKSDKYSLLLEDDGICLKNDLSSPYFRVVWDDVILHEQLALDWLNPSIHPSHRNSSHDDSDIRKPRSLSEGKVSFWLLRAEVILGCSKSHPHREPYHIIVDQWLEPSSWKAGSRGSTPQLGGYDADSTHPVIYSSTNQARIPKCQSALSFLHRMLVDDVRHFIVLFLIHVIKSDKYSLLLEDDGICLKNDLSSPYFRVVVDDVILHEQLALDWLNPSIHPSHRNSSHDDSDIRKPVIGACSGIFVRPSGRFVKRSLSEGKPDRSVRVDCSGSRSTPVREHITGYIRRLRISWAFSGALIPNSAGYNSSALNRSEATPPPTRRLLSPDFYARIRLTSRMLFEGNFSTERKRVLCEFFSGFWCTSAGPTNASDIDVESEGLEEACVPAVMRCDSLPDCNPTLIGGPTEPISLSADETNCDYMLNANYSNDGLSDRFVSLAILFITFVFLSTTCVISVLAPVPLVLICALVRICSQKRHLDVAEEAGDFDRCWSGSQDPPCQSEASQPCNRLFKPRLVNGYGFLRGSKSRHHRGGTELRSGLFHGRVSELSSVAEVDESDGDIRLRSAVSGRMDPFEPPTMTQSSVDANRSSCGEMELMVVDKQCQVIPNVEGLTLHRSSHSLPTVSLPTVRVEWKQSHKSSGRRRTYLCWSAFVDPISSSSSCTTSSSSSRSGSLCSHCAQQNGITKTFGRSQSCGDLPFCSTMQPKYKSGAFVRADKQTFILRSSADEAMGYKSHPLEQRICENECYTDETECDQEDCVESDDFSKPDPPEVSNSDSPDVHEMNVMANVYECTDPTGSKLRRYSDGRLHEPLVYKANLMPTTSESKADLLENESPPSG